MSSSRLAGKVLLPVSGVPLAVLCASRVMRNGLDLILATSVERSDDVLVDVLTNNEINVYRGSLDDVLSRFVGAINDLLDDDLVVRVTADNPFVDDGFVRSLVDNFCQQDLDYLGTSSPLDALPYGLSAEVMNVRAIRQADASTTSDYEREHVTPWIRNNLRADVVDGRKLLGNRDLSCLRCTVDTFDDYLRANEVFKCISANPVDVEWEELVSVLQKMEFSSEFHVPYRNKRRSIESVVALGTAQLGLDYGIANESGMPEKHDAILLVRNAIEYGVNWIDTARGYGLSEQRVGEALLDGWQSRTRVVTKLDPLTHLSAESSVSCVESAVSQSLFASMHALGVKKLDVLLLHRWQHRKSHKGKIWGLLVAQKKQGLINELGASIYNPDEAIEALSDMDVSHLQIPFNLLDHRWLDENFQKALSKRPDVRIHVRSVFLQGLLISDDNVWPAWDAESSERVIKINDLVKSLGRKNRTDLCVAYILAHDWVDSIVIGVETNEQLLNNLKAACEKPLTLEECNIVVDHLSDIPERLINPSQW